MKSGLPAEHYGRLYMKQAWGGSQKVAYRHLLAIIVRELNSPMTRCPDCEEPYIPVVLSWPCRSRPAKPNLRRRYVLCPYCGYKHEINKSGWRKRSIFTPAQIKEIIELYQAQVSPHDIAKRMGCSAGTVRNYVRRSGVPLRPQGGSAPQRGVSHQDLETTRFLYEKLGWTRRQIARYMGVGESTIAKRVAYGGMHRFGVIPKTKEPNRRPRKRTQGASKTASSHLEKV